MNSGYIIIKKINDFENIYSVNPLYVIIGEVDRLIEEKNRSSYLVFDSMEENKEVLTKYTLLWDGIKKEIKTINGGKGGEYGKDFMKIKFESLDKPLKLSMLTITVRLVFEKDGKSYLQAYLDGGLYEL